MSVDIFSKERSRRARHSSYFYYLSNSLLSMLPPFIRYPVLKSILGNMGEKTVIESGVFFSGFKEVYIGQDVFVGRESSFYAYLRSEGKASITIGDHVLIAPHVVATTLGHDYTDLRMPNACTSIVIEAHVWVGVGAIILPGVTLHEGSVVAAGAVVTQSVDPWKVVAGCPARVIKERPRKHFKNSLCGKEAIECQEP